MNGASNYADRIRTCWMRVQGRRGSWRLAGIIERLVESSYIAS
jgi:hypothetical protein